MSRKSDATVLKELFEDIQPTESQEDVRAKGELATLAAQYALLDRQVADIEPKMKELKERRDAAENLLLKAMQENHVKSLKLRDGSTVIDTVRSVFTLPPKTEPERREEAIRWLRRVGAKDIIEESLHHSSLNAFMRERMEQEKELRPDLLKRTDLHHISRRGGGKE